jgi:hypothetical protein
MATRVKEYDDPETGLRLIEYDNGMIRRADNGYIYKPSEQLMIKDSQDSIALHRARRELKRQIVRETASANVNAEKYGAQHGDMAYIAALTEKITEKAMNPKDPKQVDAARFLMKEAGDSEDQDLEDTGADVGAVRGMLSDLAKIAGAAIQLHAKKSD